MTANPSRLVALLSAILLAAALRLVPHPPNFTPIGAMALFSGAYFGRRGLAFVAPLAAMLLSDAVIGFYSGMQYTYGAVVLVVLVGWAARSRFGVASVAAGTVATSVLFFVVSNFGTWLSSGMYAHSFAGLAACFTAAIPFFQNTVAGDICYATLLFGGFALLERALPVIRRAPEPQPA
jgi:hypothetical protein